MTDYPFINLVGLELEGFFKPDNQTHRIHGDGSVDMRRIREMTPPTKIIPFYTAGTKGEKSSEPFDNLEALEKWLVKEYPDRRNVTCGFHVNISLTSRVILRQCVRRDIHEAMIGAIVKWAKRQRYGRAFQNRLKPNAEYSRLNFAPNSKYQAINWSKVRDYGFIEYRIFSQVMPKEKAMKAINFLVGLTNFVAEKVAEYPADTEQLGIVKRLISSYN